MSHPIPNHACSACGGQGNLTPQERANAQAPYPCPKCWDGGTPEEHRLRKIERRQRMIAGLLAAVLRGLGRDLNCDAAIHAATDIAREWEGEL